MVDIDYFKKLNDTYGHDTGDQVLRMIAQKLSKVHSDAKVFRYGGEEFVIVFPEKTPKEAYHYLENCRRTIENTPFIIRGKDRKQRSAVDRGKYLRNTQEEIKVTVSIGVASSNINPADAEKVLIAADEMLYDAKETGRNKVVLHGR